MDHVPVSSNWSWTSPFKAVLISSIPYTIYCRLPRYVTFLVRKMPKFEHLSLTVHKIDFSLIAERKVDSHCSLSVLINQYISTEITRKSANQLSMMLYGEFNLFVEHLQSFGILIGLRPTRNFKYLTSFSQNRQ
jgi:hypothetical protein